MPHDPYKSLYLHIPFCKQRCHYCDFATNGIEREAPIIDQYIEDLCLEIRRACSAGELSEIQTIYIGGGTPTHVGNNRLSGLLYMITTSINMENVKEFTMEANPESLSEAIVKDSFAMGVNRLSIGVQSFDDEVLNILGRVHDSKKASQAINLAKQRFENISIDLMCGIPGQSDDSFKNSLQTAIDLGLTHISIYPLSIERNTLLYRMAAHGQIGQIDQDQQARHMEMADSILQNAGFVHYEIASFAKPDYQSQHNLIYWTGVPYMGLGSAATTMTQNSQRRMRVTDGHVEDDLNPRQMAAEDCMLAMRTKYGIGPELYKRSKELLPEIDSTLENLIELGMIKKQDESFVPTKSGWLLGNEVFSRLLELA